MARETKDINILGIDRRPLERQNVPGLCKTLKNLQPAGPVDDPYWIPEPNVDSLKNDAETAFDITDKNLIVRAAWYVRSSVGKYGEDGSLKRLVCLFSDGNLKIIEPNGGVSNDTWTVVTTKDLSPGGTIDCSFARMNNLLAVNVTDGGAQAGIYFIVDDLIVDFELPRLPHIIGMYEGLDLFSKDEYDLGLDEGLGCGLIYYSYGYRMHDGSIVRMSSPQHIDMPFDLDGGLNSIVNYKLRFFHDGFRQFTEPDNLDFWEDQIESVVIMVGGYKPKLRLNELPGSLWDLIFDLAAGEVPEFLVNVDPEDDDYENLLLYEVASFSFLDPSGKTVEERTKTFVERGDNISSYPLAGVGAESNKLTADIIDSYNSRLLLGGTSEDFPLPGTEAFRTLFDRAFYAEDDGGTLKVYVFGHEITMDDVVSSTNLSSIAVDGYDLLEEEASVGDKTNRVTATIDDTTWDISIQIFGYYTVTISNTDVPAMDSPIPIDNYSLAATTDVLLVVEIETDEGIFLRVADVDIGPRFGGALVYNAFYGGNKHYGAFVYPDRRAQRLHIWENDGGYTLKSVGDLKAAQTQDYAFLLPSAPANGSEYSLTVPSVTENDKKSYIPNRIQVSETNSPFTFLADKTYYVGSETETITGFASNTLAISEGQFGQYPLYVFFESQIWTLEQGRDPSIAFNNISPVSLVHGAANARQITNVGRTIVFVYKDGIFSIAGHDIREIGQPIGNYPGDSAIDFSTLTLAARQRNGAHELLVSTGSILYVMNMRFGRWYSIDRAREWFFALGGELYSIDSNGDIWDELAGLSTNVTFTMDMNPVHFLAPEMLKRLFALYLRGSTRSHTLTINFDGSSNQVQTTEMATLVKFRSVFAFRIQLTGTMTPGTDYLEAISAKIEGRYPRRTKISSSVEV